MTKSPTEHKAGLSTWSKDCLATFILDEIVPHTHPLMSLRASGSKQGRGFWGDDRMEV